MINELPDEFSYWNDTPVEELLGLTPNQMHSLLYKTFSPTSHLRYQDAIDNTTLDQVPLFRIAEDFLKILERDKHIKLTPLGALPKKVMVELYEKKYLLDEFIESGLIKLWKEQDCISIRSARFAAEFAGFVKKVHGRLSLTKKGAKLLQAENRVQLFQEFLESFTGKFGWGYNDGYPDKPIGQLGWAFSLFMLNKFGDEPRAVNFYAQKYIKAFPMFISEFPMDYDSPQRQYASCYAIRTFPRFFLWFGFIETEEKKSLLDYKSNLAKKTSVVNQLFLFEEIRSGD